MSNILVDGSKTILKNDGLRQWEGLSFFIMENKIHVPNHQPVGMIIP